MYLKVITKDYRVRYFDLESPEGRFELLKRYYGLKNLRPGSYFSLAIPLDDAFYDWSNETKESFLN